jgi:hypothetical protein
MSYEQILGFLIVNELEFDLEFVVDSKSILRLLAGE